jgi:general secretion pathway protein K
MKRRTANRGVALITAMLITALASMVAANLAWDNALDVRRTMVLLNHEQAVQVALGAESWVIGILHQDLEDSETDHLGEIWAIELPGLPIDGGEVTGNIEDLQGRFCRRLDRQQHRGVVSGRRGRSDIYGNNPAVS